MTARAPIACRCGCSDAGGSDVHRIIAALACADLDAAMEAGLLESDDCPSCSPACRVVLQEARDSRRTALAARERFRVREARLARRREERSRRETAKPQSSTSPSLPPAAAAALARARAKAAGTMDK